MLVQKVKSGAYFELKSEVFEVLNSSANRAALLENSTGVFETAEKVRHFLQILPLSAPVKLAPPSHEEEVKAKLHSLIEQPVRIDFLESLYEPGISVDV
jgi:hypothetical protein